MSPQDKCVYESVLKTRMNKSQIGGEHYKKYALQPWDAISSWGLCYFLGNVVKYVVRCGDKGGIEDLKKARHYLDKKIEILEGNESDKK